jgi:hypothetical protein
VWERVSGWTRGGEGGDGWGCRLSDYTVHDRYHIGQKDLGLLETALGEDWAFQQAKRFARDAQETVMVFDSMAKVGTPNHWEVDPLGCVRIIGTRAALARTEAP